MSNNYADLYFFIFNNINDIIKVHDEQEKCFLRNIYILIYIIIDL